MKEIFNETLDLYTPVGRLRNAKLLRTQRRDTKQSLAELPFVHSENFSYIQNMTPLWVRLRLNKHRGNRKALVWRIRLLQHLNVIGPQTAIFLLDEYMITATSCERTTAPNEWTCTKCGTYNEDTALFCKDCGEYK